MLEALRTPYGRRGGALSSCHPVDLLALALSELAERTGLEPAVVDDVVVGCASQVGAQAANIGRRAVLAAGWPEHIPGVTVGTQGTSGAQAVHFAAQSVMSGTQQLVVAAGVEVMSAVPLGATLAVPSVGKPFGKRLTERYRDGGGFVPPGRAAEALAQDFALSREALDGYALSSMDKAKRAAKSLSYVLPVPLGGPRAKALSVDEGVSRTLSAQAVRRLSPLFEPGGVITAANMASEADGAAVVLVASGAVAERLGLVPKAMFTALASAAGDPSLWPLAAVSACRLAVARAGTGFDDIDRFEIHESSAAAALAWLSSTGAEPGRLNPDGGALATGSPLGAVGVGMFAGAVDALVGGAGHSLVSIAGDGGTATACVLSRP